MLGLMLGGVILFSSNVTALAAITSSSTSPTKGTNQSDYSSFVVTNGYGRIAGGIFHGCFKFSRYFLIHHRIRRFALAKYIPKEFK